jgi:putative phage-type endonuclease
MTIASGTCITPANYGEWLETRDDGIGGSDSASVLGVGHGTALQVYLRKLGLMPPPDMNMAMRIGKLLEQSVGILYREDAGHEFASEQLFLRSPNRPFMTATLDFVRTDGRIVEAKVVGARSAHLWGEAGTDEVPAHCLVQVHHQMLVSGTDVVDVAALIGGIDFRRYTVYRDDDVAARIVAVEEEFWSRVQRRDPPSVDPARDGAALARLWPRAEGEVELEPVGELLVESWEAHGRAIREHEAARDRARTELLCHLGEAASARLADSRVLTRRVVEVAEQQITRRAFSYVDLRIRKGF